MAYRLDFPFAVLAGGSLLTVIGAIVLGPSSSVAVIVPVAMISLVFGYAAYWAFSVGRALVIPIYRNQALGVGLVAVVAGLFVEAGGTFLQQYFSSYGVAELFIYPFSLATFFWVDTSMLAARRADPAFRDTLHWGLVRKFLWSLIVAAIVSSSVIVVVFGLSGLPTCCGASSPATPLQNSIIYNPLFGIGSFFLPVLLPLISGAVFLPAAVRRSKDLTMRTHLRWFGGFALLQVVGLWSGLITVNSGLLSTPIALVLIDSIGGYCLYRSAMSLAKVHEG